MRRGCVLSFLLGKAAVKLRFTNNNTAHSIDVIDIACVPEAPSVMTDTLASSFEYMKRADLIDTVIGKLRDELAGEEMDGAHQIGLDQLTGGSQLESFLEAGDCVRHRKGMVMEWSEFTRGASGKRAFDAYVKHKHPGQRWVLKTEQRERFVQRGYRVVHENMCKACGKPGLSGCCDAYTSMNRVKKWRIIDMELRDANGGDESGCGGDGGDVGGLGDLDGP